MEGKSGGEGAPIKTENETGVSDRSDDSPKNLECRDEDKEMVKIKPEINDDFDDILDHTPLKERLHSALSREALKLKEPIRQELPIGSNSLLHQSKDVLDLPSSTLTKIKTEPLDYSYEGNTSTTSLDESSRKDVLNLPSSTLTKTEPLDYSYGHSLGNTSTTSQDVFSRTTDCKYRLDGEQIKGENETSAEPCEDDIDHMLLRDRMKLPASKESSDVKDHSRNYDLSQSFVPAAAETPIASDATHLLTNKRRRRHKKTATASVETALEEDAPGLIQMLHEKGIIMSEMKLYGAKESDELIDDDDSCSVRGNFSGLESVISKFYSQKPSLLKLSPLKSSKSEKKSYCLDCLVALVEQSRYLVRRKWPVEWGWCRDLNSFIFVFRRHNRIVLERPEYGYATYFFQLLKQLPVKWQIKRLVIAMKFANSSRATIIENKPLKVGEDLSEEEANVLKDYGWTENNGLAAMLHYHDRVVHFQSKVDKSSEWKARIVKMLTEAIEGGYIFLSESEIPKKAREYMETFGLESNDDEESD